METINSMATAAAKAVWGENNTKDANPNAATTTTADQENVKPATETMNTETLNNETHGTEPVSGKLGDTSKGEPFDAGNIETGATNPAVQAEPKTDTTTTTTAPTIESKGPTTEQPSTNTDSSFKAAQADIRDPDSNPTADPKTEAVRKNVDDTGGVDDSENPVKTDGPGPRPVEEVAKEHGGDAGRSNEAVGKSQSAGAGAGATADEDEDGPNAKSKGEGTGEKYVKSTGLQADGGDFDATKPGAGREADRLLEEKGIANPAAAAAAAGGKKTEGEEETADTTEGKEKKSLKDKIKSKLHKN